MGTQAWPSSQSHAERCLRQLGLRHRVAAHPRRLSSDRLSATPQSDRHRSCHHTPLYLIQVEQDRREESRELLTTGLHCARLHCAYQQSEDPKLRWTTKGTRHTCIDVDGAVVDVECRR